MLFINFSNHPSANWLEEQYKAASQYGQIVDIPFPSVSPQWTSEQVIELAKEYAEKIISMQPDIVMCQGEFTLSYHVIALLKENGIKVVAACSERHVTEDEAGKKIVEFCFEQFREY